MSDKVCVEPLEIDDYEDRYMASTDSISDEEFSDFIESVHRDAVLEVEYEEMLMYERDQAEYEDMLREDMLKDDDHTAYSDNERYEELTKDFKQFEHNLTLQISSKKLFSRLHNQYVKTMNLEFNCEDYSNVDVDDTLHCLKELKNNLMKNYLKFVSDEDTLYEKLCIKRKNGDELTIKEKNFMYDVEICAGTKQKDALMHHLCKNTIDIDKYVEQLEKLNA